MVAIGQTATATGFSEWRVWTGPNEDEVNALGELKAPVPPERWPYGPPVAHQDCCVLFSDGLFCDCTASEYDPDE